MQCKKCGKKVSFFSYFFSKPGDVWGTCDLCGKGFCRKCLNIDSEGKFHAQKFVLVDKNGKTQALLGLADGSAKLFFFNEKREAPMILSSNNLTFNDPDKKNNVQVGLDDKTGSPRIILQEDGGNSLATLLSHGLAFGDISKPHIVMSDSGVSSQKKGAHFLVADKNGRPIWVAPAN